MTNASCLANLSISSPSVCLLQKQRLICERPGADDSMAENGAKGHYNELHVVFDFFTDNPQKVLPMSDCKHSENPFYDPYWGSIRTMQQNEQFLEGMLLRSVDVSGKSMFDLQGSLTSYLLKSR